MLPMSVGPKHILYLDVQKLIFSDAQVSLYIVFKRQLMKN